MDHRLEIGDEILDLLNKIRESKISVVIFSEEYASSKWCLRELVEIMECKEKNGQTVIPVFYNVAVSDVRHQKGSFKDGFGQLEKNFYEELAKDKAAWIDQNESCMASFDKREKEFHQEMQIWRDALKKASDIKGCESSQIRPDTKLISELVRQITKELMSEYMPLPCDCDGLFGFEERLKQVMSLLCLDNDDIRIIGIWGMGGIGKTTLADVVYQKISGKKYGKCFIQNFRQRVEQCGGLVRVLQIEVLSKVLREQEIKLDGATLPLDIKIRLCQEKVFIVLDDVDSFIKLQELAGGLNQFCPGSRIIITTRDRHILKNCGVNDDYIYEVKGLSDQAADKMFCEYAFRQNPPSEDLMALSHEILWAINGNPLGLKVVGSSLLGSNKKEWKSALSGLKKSPEILEVLQISYNGLKKKDQCTFLDIACFFVGEHEDYVAEILDNCSSSMKTLVNKSLVTISNSKIIEMHDLLQEMGREIVCEESLNPGNRSRLWTKEDVLDTLTNGDGTKAIRGIFLDMSGMHMEHLSSQAFEKMKYLKFFKFYDSTFYDFSFHGAVYFPSFNISMVYNSNVVFQNDLSYLSDNLRSLNWLGYPLRTLPSNFIPKNLVELNLRESYLEKLWEDTMHAPNLKWIILKNCPYLTKVLDLLDVPLLEKIDIRCCKSFLGFPPLVQHFNHLRQLTLEYCENLKSFPNNHFPSLTYLCLSGCNKLTSIGPLDAPLVEQINIHDCENLLGFPSPLHHFNNLHELNLRSCENLQIFPNNIPFPSLVSVDFYGCHSIIELYFLDVPLLENINIENCSSLREFSSPCDQHFNNLHALNMRDCKKLQSFAKNIHFSSLTSLNLYGSHNLTELYLLNAPILEKINLENCSSLREFSSPVDQAFINLRELNMRNCLELQSFDKNIHFSSLISLDLCGCVNLTQFSKILDALLLEKINLENCKSLVSFPLPVQHFNNLCELNMRNCKNLQSFPNDIPFQSLEFLNLNGCYSLTKFSSPVDKTFNNLRELSMRNCRELQSFGKNIHFPSFIFLDLYGCVNLTQFSEFLDAPLIVKIDLTKCSTLLYFPSPFQHFNNLSSLNLRDCKNLRSFPSNNINFPSLGHLDFRRCINLTKFPRISGNIKYLYMRKTLIDEVPSSIENLTELVKLDLEGCMNLNHISINICKLKALRQLNLSKCSALECFPKILDTMASLKILCLSGTTIKKLHHSIENLSGLNVLSLSGCKNLEMLPISIYNLPSLCILDLSGCTKLENLPGNSVTDLSNCGESATTKPPICRFNNCELFFTNCLNLNKTAVINIMELQINQHRDMTTKGCGTQAVNVRYFYPGSEVPGWFKPLTGGSSINIQISSHDAVNGHLIGLAACAVIGFYDESDVWKISYHCRCHCMKASCLINYVETVCQINSILMDSDHVALWYSNGSDVELCGECTNYLFEFGLQQGESGNCRVKYCGVCPIYENHNITQSCIANETCAAAAKDFGETFVIEQDKSRKFFDEAETSGSSNYETFGAAAKDFGEMSVKGQGKIKKFSDGAESSCSSNDETCGVAAKDFGKTSHKGQDKIRKFPDEAETSCCSNDETCGAFWSVKAQGKIRKIL